MKPKLFLCMAQSILPVRRDKVTNGVYLELAISALFATFALSSDEHGTLKKRQTDGPDFECTSFDNCGNHSFVGVTFEDLTFTDEQRAMCNNDTACLFDLGVTGDEQFANTTLEASEENMAVQQLISKKLNI